MTLRPLPWLVAALLICAPALAQDDPAPDTPAQAEPAKDDAPADHPELSEDGFVVGNDTFAVKCNSAVLDCRSGSFGSVNRRKLEVYALLAADMGARVQDWLDGMDFPASRIEPYEDDGRSLMLLDKLPNTGGAGALDDGTTAYLAWNAGKTEGRLIVPLKTALELFLPGSPDLARSRNFPDGLGGAALEALEALAVPIDPAAYDSNLVQAIAHELFHSRIPTPESLDWLDEAMAVTAEQTWRALLGFSPNFNYAMRLDRRFNTPGKDANGDYYGYGKAYFLYWTGVESRSAQTISYLANFRVPDASHRGGGMHYLYESKMMPTGYAFPQGFPRFLAQHNIIIPQGRGAPVGSTWRQYEQEEYFQFANIARPVRDQEATETREHEFERTVDIFAADPVLLENIEIRADPMRPEHERLMLATVSIPEADRAEDLRLVFEHKLPDDNIHRYITLADGKYDAGFVRVAHAPPDLSGPLEPQDYTLQLRLEPVKFDTPACLTPGDSFEIEAEIEAESETVELDETDNISFEVSGPAKLKDRTVTVTGAGEVQVTAVLASHRTRPPEGVTSRVPHEYPDRRVDLEPVRVSPEGGCTCDPELFVSMGHPKLYETVNMFGAALGGGDGPAAPIGQMPGELGALISGLMGAGRPAVRPSEAEMRVSYGSGAAGGLVCADPVAARDGGQGNIVLSFYTPGPTAALGGVEMFGMSVQHDGWEGWPPNSKAQIFVELPGVTADDLRAGRSYPARLHALQGTGFAGIFGYHDGTFHDYVPYQEAFEGQALGVNPIALGGSVRVEEIDDGKLTGTLRLSGSGARLDMTYWRRAGSDPPVFEHEGTETEVPLTITARFSLRASDAGERIALRGSFETLRAVELD